MSSVDDFLTDLDDALATATAPAPSSTTDEQDTRTATATAPADRTDTTTGQGTATPGHDTATGPQDTATVEDRTRPDTLDRTGQDTPPRVVRVTGKSGRLPDWWAGPRSLDALSATGATGGPDTTTGQNTETRHDETDTGTPRQDTETGQDSQRDTATVNLTKTDTPDETPQHDNDHDTEPEHTTAPSAAAKASRLVATVRNAGPIVATNTDGGGLINHPRGRQALFATTAYGMGWSLHLDDAFTGLISHANDYATPVAACALCVGFLGLAMRSRAGSLVFISSLGLITVMEMVEPAWIVGGSLALGLQMAYRLARGWIGRYGEKWPWKGVVWAAHVPAATATVTALLYGTN